MSKNSINFIRSYFKEKENFIPLHIPSFIGNEKKYLEDCIDSTFVSSVGAYVDLFEEKMSQFTQTKKSVAVVNGTSALQVALRLVGVKNNDEVITQALTFVATANAILYNNQTIQYSPIFESIYKYMGLSKDDTNARLLGSLFFRQSNVDILQDTLIRETYVKSGNKFIIKKQKQGHLINAMQKQFIRYGQYLPCQLKEQIEQLNRRVIKSIIPGIISNCIAHYNVEKKYGKNQLGLMDRPERTFNNYKPLVVENERFDVFLQPDYNDVRKGGGGIGGGMS